jgi:hypothetical protein
VSATPAAALPLTLLLPTRRTCCSTCEKSNLHLNRQRPRRNAIDTRDELKSAWQDDMRLWEGRICCGSSLRCRMRKDNCANNKHWLSFWRTLGRRQALPSFSNKCDTTTDKYETAIGNSSRIEQKQQQRQWSCAERIAVAYPLINH